MTPKLQLALLATVALIGTAVTASSSASAQLNTHGGQKFSVILSGANECTNLGVCGVGDPNASGTADISVNPGLRRICWEITTGGIHSQYGIVGAHIHSGAAGTNGGIVVHLSAEENGSATGCTAKRALSQILIDQILSSPQDFYVNIHYVDQDPTLPNLQSYSGGGIRGQLRTGRLK